MTAQELVELAQRNLGLRADDQLVTYTNLKLPMIAVCNFLIGVCPEEFLEDNIGDLSGIRNQSAYSINIASQYILRLKSLSENASGIPPYKTCQSYADLMGIRNRTDASSIYAYYRHGNEIHINPTAPANSKTFYGGTLLQQRISASTSTIKVPTMMLDILDHMMTARAARLVNMDGKATEEFNLAMNQLSYIYAIARIQPPEAGFTQAQRLVRAGGNAGA